MKLTLTALTLSLLMLISCSTPTSRVSPLGMYTFHGLKPVSAWRSEGAFHAMDIVSSLTPTLEWEPSPEPGVTYDLVIYAAISQKGGGFSPTPGRQVYYREGLVTTRHTVEQPLSRDANYWWSVRTRTGNVLSEWSKYDYTGLLGDAGTTKGNFLWGFQTPYK